MNFLNKILLIFFYFSIIAGVSLFLLNKVSHNPALGLLYFLFILSIAITALSCIVSIVLYLFGGFSEIKITNCLMVIIVYLSFILLAYLKYNWV